MTFFLRHSVVGQKTISFSQKLRFELRKRHNFRFQIWRLIVTNLRYGARQTQFQWKIIGKLYGLLNSVNTRCQWPWVSLKITFAVWNLSYVNNLVHLTMMCLHVCRKMHMTSIDLWLKLYFRRWRTCRRFWRLRAVLHTECPLTINWCMLWITWLKTVLEDFHVTTINMAHNWLLWRLLAPETLHISIVASWNK